MVGCDIVEIDRIKSAIDRYGERFINRILTNEEREIYEKRNRSPEFFAGRFVAKESISKSFKTGVSESLKFIDIKILNGEKGEPVVYIKGIKCEDIDVSISHGRDYSIAVSILRGVR